MQREAPKDLPKVVLYSAKIILFDVTRILGLHRYNMLSSLKAMNKYNIAHASQLPVQNGSVDTNILESAPSSVLLIVVIFLIQEQGMLPCSSKFVYINH